MLYDVLYNIDFAIDITASVIGYVAVLVIIAALFMA